MRCIGVDIGSSSIKGAVLNVAEGVIEDVVRAPFPNALEGLPSGFHEVSLDAVLLGVRGVLEGTGPRGGPAGTCAQASKGRDQPDIVVRTKRWSLLRSASV